MTGEYFDTSVIIAIFLVIIGLSIGIPLRRKFRRKRLVAAGLSWDQSNFLMEHSFLCTALPSDLRMELFGTISVFLDEMEFEPCGGLEEVTDEMKLLVAAQACIPMLSNKLDIYPKLQSILVYPGAYVAGGGKSMLGGNVVDAPPSVRLGESWSRGNIVLAWDQVQQNARRHNEGQDVTIHEFAHQIAQQDGSSNGIPFRKDPDEQKEWAEILCREFEHLREETEHGHREVIDSYGAVNEAEFFAVSTEAFFCAPHRMYKAHPELYREFTEFYKTDPASWPGYN